MQMDSAGSINVPKYRKPSKSAVLAQAKGTYERAQKAVEQANRDLFYARQALDKAQAEYVDELKNKVALREIQHEDSDKGVSLFIADLPNINEHR